MSGRGSADRLSRLLLESRQHGEAPAHLPLVRRNNKELKSWLSPLSSGWPAWKAT